MVAIPSTSAGRRRTRSAFTSKLLNERVSAVVTRFLTPMAVSLKLYSAVCKSSLALLAMSAHACSVACTNAVTTSTTPAAHAVGVLKALYATSSAMLKSTSWPMPVNTGLEHLPIAAEISSESNANKSTFDPPPRTSITMSMSSRRPTRVIASTIVGTAASPCTRTSCTKISKPIPEFSSSCNVSACAALPTLVISAIRNGTTGSATRRLAS